MKLSWALSRVR